MSFEVPWERKLIIAGQAFLAWCLWVLCYVNCVSWCVVREKSLLAAASSWTFLLSLNIVAIVLCRRHQIVKTPWTVYEASIWSTFNFEAMPAPGGAMHVTLVKILNHFLVSYILKTNISWIFFFTLENISCSPVKVFWLSCLQNAGSQLPYYQLCSLELHHMLFKINFTFYKSLPCYKITITFHPLIPGTLLLTAALMRMI